MGSTSEHADGGCEIEGRRVSSMSKEYAEMSVGSMKYRCFTHCENELFPRNRPFISRSSW